ncbi:MAG: hypothetical protein C0467_06920 [Planctomycetaceae bacterium]|nr:hypothetical protein [Planctomycetaceae bacterium]
MTMAKSWATITEKVMVAEDGKTRSLTMIDLDTLPGLMFSIDARKVKEHVREKLARDQRWLRSGDRYAGLRVREIRGRWTFAVGQLG